MDILFDKNCITIQANPHYYDYVHNLRLNYDEYKFELLDGGCQHVDSVYNGYYDYDDEYLTLFWG